MPACRFEEFLRLFLDAGWSRFNDDYFGPIPDEIDRQGKANCPGTHDQNVSC
jgi:hypothetical protein